MIEFHLDARSGVAPYLQLIHQVRQALRLGSWVLCMVISAGFFSCLPRSGAWPLPSGLGGVIGAVELSMVPGEDTRLLLSSLVVVIVGGMGSVVGAAIGAAILGLAETYGLAYAPTYSVVFTFVILVLVLAFRPRGILGRPA